MAAQMEIMYWRVVRFDDNPIWRNPRRKVLLPSVSKDIAQDYAAKLNAGKGLRFVSYDVEPDVA